MFDLRYLRHNESIATYFLKNAGLIFRSVRESLEIGAKMGEGSVDYCYTYQTDLVDTKLWESLSRKEYDDYDRYQETYGKTDRDRHFRNEKFYKLCPQEQPLSVASKALWLAIRSKKSSRGLSRSASRCRLRMTDPSYGRERPVAEMATYLEYSILRLEWILLNHAGINYHKNMDFFSSLPESFVEFLIQDEYVDMRFSPGQWLKDTERLEAEVGLIDIVFHDIPIEIRLDLEKMLREYKIETASVMLN